MVAQCCIPICWVPAWIPIAPVRAKSTARAPLMLCCLTVTCSQLFWMNVAPFIMRRTSRRAPMGIGAVWLEKCRLYTTWLMMLSGKSINEPWTKSKLPLVGAFSNVNRSNELWICSALKTTTANILCGFSTATLTTEKLIRAKECAYLCHIPLRMSPIRTTWLSPLWRQNKRTNKQCCANLCFCNSIFSQGHWLRLNLSHKWWGFRVYPCVSIGNTGILTLLVCSKRQRTLTGLYYKQLALKVKDTGLHRSTALIEIVDISAKVDFLWHIKIRLRGGGILIQYGVQ